MNWRAEDAIAKLNEQYGKQVLISFFIGTDDRDSNAHIIHVGVRNRLLLLHTNTNACLLLIKKRKLSLNAYTLYLQEVFRTKDLK